MTGLCNRWKYRLSTPQPTIIIFGNSLPLVKQKQQGIPLLLREEKLPKKTKMVRKQCGFSVDGEVLETLRKESLDTHKPLSHIIEELICKHLNIKNPTRVKKKGYVRVSLAKKIEQDLEDDNRTEW